jgi:hypothetical protein
MKMETTHVSETSTLYNHTPGNYPKEDNIRYIHCVIEMHFAFVRITAVRNSGFVALSLNGKVFEKRETVTAEPR